MTQSITIKTCGQVELGGFFLGVQERDQLARFDGFEDARDFLAFFIKQYPWGIEILFEGVWIVWGQDAVDWFNNEVVSNCSAIEKISIKR